MNDDEYKMAVLASLNEIADILHNRLPELEEIEDTPAPVGQPAPIEQQTLPPRQVLHAGLRP